MDDVTSGALGAGETDDLRSQIMAAMSDSAGGEAAPVADTAPVVPPADAPADTAAADRSRDAQGRFAPKDGQPAAAKPVAAAEAPVAPQAPATEPAPAHAETGEPTAVRPPPGWSPAAKAAFDTLPAEVRDAVAKREAEVNKGFERLAEFKGLDEFAARAKGLGITTAQLAGQYAAAEHKLATNFPRAVLELSQQMGHHPFAVASAIIGVEPRALAQLLQAARGQGQPQAGEQQAAAQPGLPPQLHEHLSRLSGAVNGLVSERVAHQQASAASIVEAFFNDPANPYAANLETEILDLVSRDQDRVRDPQGALKRAYDRAVWLNPETRSVAINGEFEARSKAEAAKATEAAKRQSEAAAQARSGMRSLTGSPVAGAPATAGPAPTLREEIQKAFGSNRA